MRLHLCQRTIAVLCLVAGLGLAVVPAIHATEDSLPLASIPLTNAGQFFFVEVTVNGAGPFQFVLDDGMTTTVIDRRVAEKLKLEAEGEVLIVSLGFAGFEIEDVQAKLVDLTKIWGDGAKDGVIALDLFSDYLTTLDLPGQRLILRRGELPPADGDEILDYALVSRSNSEAFAGRQVATIEVAVGDDNLTVDLNPTSWGTLTLHRDYADKLPLTSEPGMIGNTVNDKGTFPILGASLKGTLAIAGHKLKNPGVYFSDTFDHPSVGSGLLDSFEITYDQAQRRIRIHKPNPANHPMLVKAAGLPRQSGHGADLRTTFNQNLDKVRVMVLLSPT